MSAQFWQGVALAVFLSLFLYVALGALALAADGGWPACAHSLAMIFN